MAARSKAVALSLLGLISIGICVLPLAGCREDAGAPAAGRATVLSAQLSAEPASLDPTLAEDGLSLSVLCNTMEGLVGYDGGGKLVQLAASSYVVTDGGRRYDFTIRPEARWSDGLPVTARDFVTSFRRALTPSSGSKLAGILFPIRGARELFLGAAQSRVADGKPPEPLGVREEGGHLILELKEAAPYFIQALTMPVALPLRQDILDANGGRWPDTAPGDGPYRILSHQIERRIRLARNEHYWAGAAAIPEVDLVVAGDETTALNLFERGELDLMSKISPENLPRLRKRPGLVHTDPFLATYYLAFNLHKRPFSDVLWRQAVSGSIRREQIVQTLGEGQLPARSWVPPGLEGSIPYSDPAADFAGAVSRAKGGRAFGRLEAAYDTSPRNALVMQEVQQDLKRALGLELSLSNLDWAAYLKAVHSDPPPLFRLGILSPFMDPIEILQSLTTGNPSNYLGWSNARYDGLVAEIARLSPGPRRAELIRQAQRLLVDREAIVVPVYHYVQNHAVGPRVRGFRVNPFGEVRFSELRLEGEGAP